MSQMTSDSENSTYEGSHLLSPIARMAGLPIDQFNFLFCQLFALVLSICFRRFLPPTPKNTFRRHLFAATLGIGLGFFCFGVKVWHLFAQSATVYLIIRILPPTFSYLVVFAFCLIYLSAIHIYRLIYDYGNYTLDISGPMMVNTQKLTAFAFAFYDGYRSRNQSNNDKKNSVLNADQQNQKITALPNPLEFLSYIFYFHGICVGPLCFYRDYIHYIEGTNLQIVPNSSSRSTTTEKFTEVRQPSTFWPVVNKLAQSALWCFILLFFTPKYPIEYNLDAELSNSPWLKRLVYLLFSTFCIRAKYYFAFILSEAVNNAAGLGYDGHDEKNPQIERWTLLTTVKPFDLELATSLKVVIDVWNMQTGLWLRRICYDRLKTGRTLGVFVLSALWHGFYPGYYICFILAAFETYAGRGIRRQIRPFFQKNSTTKFVYECLTWIGTQIGLNFAVTPFALMEVGKAWRFYESWYFSVPVICVLLAMILHGGSSKPDKNRLPPQEIMKHKST